MSMAVIIVGWLKHLLGVVPGKISSESVLHVTTEETFLGEGGCVLEGVVAPAVHAPEEKRTISFLGHVLIQVVLE